MLLIFVTHSLRLSFNIFISVKVSFKGLIDSFKPNISVSVVSFIQSMIFGLKLVVISEVRGCTKEIYLQE